MILEFRIPGSGLVLLEASKTFISGFVMGFGTG
jgi:hypothetical protein